MTNYDRLNVTAIAESHGKLLALIVKDWNYGNHLAWLAIDTQCVPSTRETFEKHARATINSY